MPKSDASLASGVQRFQKGRHDGIRTIAPDRLHRKAGAAHTLSRQRQYGAFDMRPARIDESTVLALSRERVRCFRYASRSDRCRASYEVRISGKWARPPGSAPESRNSG